VPADNFNLYKSPKNETLRELAVTGTRKLTAEIECAQRSQELFVLNDAYTE